MHKKIHVKTKNKICAAVLVFVLAGSLTAGACAVPNVYAKTEAEKKRDAYKKKLKAKNSDIANINENASENEPVMPSKWTYGYLENVLDLARKSSGAFDPTLGRVSQLWNLEIDNPYIPSKSELTELLLETGWEKISMGDGEVFLKDGVQIDLGAV